MRTLPVALAAVGVAALAYTVYTVYACVAPVWRTLAHALGAL
jgi:hypothetical protein